jgi:hypothetical protein
MLRILFIYVSIISVLQCATCSPAKSQGIEEFFWGQSNCPDIEFAAFEAIQFYRSIEAWDSIPLVITLVSGFCEDNTLWEVTRLLLKMEKSTLDSTQLGTEVITWIGRVEPHIRKVRRNHERLIRLKEVADNETVTASERVLLLDSRGHFGKDSIAMLIYHWAQDLVTRQPSGSLFQFICKALARDESSMNKLVRQDLYKRTTARELYEKYHGILYETNVFHFGLQVSSHSMVGPLSKLLKGTVGVSLEGGVQVKKHRLSLGLGSRFHENTKIPFEVVRPDTTFYSNLAGNFFGAIDHNYLLASNGIKWRLYSVGGIGFSDWTLYNKPKSSDLSKLSQEEQEQYAKMGREVASGPIFKVGIQWDVFTGPGSALGFGVNYQALTYKNHPGTPLKGGIVSFGIKWMIFSLERHWPYSYSVLR